MRIPRRSTEECGLPDAVGIGLRAQHHLDVLATSPAIDFFEAHTENYIADGGPPIEALMAIRERYELSLHGVGLSLGSCDPLNKGHLVAIRRAIERFAPAQVSEHLSWSSVEGRFANDLLPLPYTDEAILHVSQRIAQVQDFIGRRLLIENVSSYLEFEYSQLSEWQFINHVASESGCGILLDLNNIYVSSRNHGFDAAEYLDAIDPTWVLELHLAGHTAVEIEGRPILIDTHGAPVCDAVWDLYRRALRRFGNTPTLIEWDTDIPALSVLLDEAAKARVFLRNSLAVAA